MPVVMLLNLGSIGGPSDGTSALSRKVDATVGPDHWDGASAFRNIAPNSYVIRTRWTDIDGRDGGL